MLNQSPSSGETTVGEFTIDVFGRFNEIEITSIVDKSGHYWFTQQVIAQALEIDNSTLTHIRQNHPAEFSEGDEYTSIVFDGKRRIVYSEEGFLTICDMATSEQAYRLRKWMRKQFRVKQQGREVIVHAKSLDRDDLSDLDPDLRIIQRMFDSLVEDRRRIKKLEVEQRQIEQEQVEIQERITETQNRLAAWEEGARVKPGEMTALQLATHCGWVSKSGGAHNLAVILAAVNEGFIEKKLMENRREQGPDGLVVEIHVFTPGGIAEFLTKIDSRYSSGQAFDIAPNDRAVQHGYKNKRNVLKVQPARASSPSSRGSD